LIVLLYRGGLRISEALALKPSDLDPVAGTVRILRGKGSKARTVGLDPNAFVFIERWMDVRRQRIKGHAALFCTLKGEPLETAYVRGLFKRLGKKAGIDKRVHAHGLRHTHAAQLASEGVPMNLIQKQLGHTSLATTNRYLEHIAPADLINAMRRREWDCPT
jgi:site-specific recombinase XerD